MHADLASYDDPHAIAGALKLYFRELPIPLITFDNYDLVLIAASKLPVLITSFKNMFS